MSFFIEWEEVRRCVKHWGWRLEDGLMIFPAACSILASQLNSCRQNVEKAFNKHNIPSWWRLWLTTSVLLNHLWSSDTGPKQRLIPIWFRSNHLENYYHFKGGYHFDFCILYSTAIPSEEMPNKSNNQLSALNTIKIFFGRVFLQHTVWSQKKSWLSVYRSSISQSNEIFLIMEILHENNLRL